MAKLGTSPSQRYHLSWITQRMVNRAPEQSHARKAPGSIAKQVLNPLGQDIQRITQEVIEERDNILVSAANIDLLDHLWRVDLNPSVCYTFTNNPDSSISYDTPQVFVTIDNTEHEITQAHENNIESLAYTAIPSRVDNGETTLTSLPVLPTTLVSDIPSTTLNDIENDSHLYVTLSDNTTWEYRYGTTVYYPKVYLKGTTRKGTEVTEALPLRYNGTFKTVNQWRSIEEVYVSYIDETASVSVDIFPWHGDGILDHRNLNVDPDGEEKWRFLNINSHSWGHSFISESYTTSDFDLIRKGIEARDIEHEIELLDDNGDNLTFDSFTMKSNTDLLFAISGDKFYVYNTKLPYPEVTLLEGESPDVKMDLSAEKWIFARDEFANIRTRILDFSNVPWKVRWTVTDPDGTDMYMDIDGNLLPLTEDAWIDNLLWEEQLWREQRIDFQLTKSGTYIVSMECMYIDDESTRTSTLTTKYLFYTPSIRPEITLDLPASLVDSEDMSFDSDGKLWLFSDDEVSLLNVYYDYFIADYGRNLLWLREQYSSVRVEV